jgi:sarcosine oxidase subunit alpha
MTGFQRLPQGGRIDRGRTLRFVVDDTELLGHPGDTLASALLANGRIRVANSIYRDRPRGIVTADGTEPNALVQLHGEVSEPMLPATRIELFDGLVADSLPGVGRLDNRSDRAVHDKKYLHVDVLVVGAGPAGLAAALAAGRSGARVMLVDDRLEPGGTLLDGPSVPAWVGGIAGELAGLPEVRVLRGASAVGYYDHNYVLVAQARRLWHVRARQVVLATGAHERPIVFADNDRPGIMLASALRRYVNNFAVLPGHDVVVFTTGDSAYATARDLVAAGARVHAVVDSRPQPPAHLTGWARDAGVEVVGGAAVIGTHGTERISAADIAPIDHDGAVAGPIRQLPCDLLAVSGGWSPAVQLVSQSGGRLRWDEQVAGFVPAPSSDGNAGRRRAAGALTGSYATAACVRDGATAGVAAAADAGFPVTAPQLPDSGGDREPSSPRPLWVVRHGEGGPGDWHTHFVDLQRDATVADIWRAKGAGLLSVEHVKRYTTIGTGADQGRTSGDNAGGALAEALSAATPADVGTTTFRPPSTPVSFALLAGRDRGHLHDPVRTTPMHSWHVEAGAEFENVGQWKRARYYPRSGESMDAAVLRECHAARTSVAVQDVSTLGKIEVVGSDAPEFLNRIYTNGFAKLPVGKARYGMMCTADGMVFDDGVCLRLAEDRYLMSTTTGNAAPVLAWLEEWLQTEWPELQVYCTSVTEQWAAVAVVGPDSRAVVRRLAPQLDCSPEAFGFMEFRDTVLGGQLSGLAARISRVSFSGELAFEIMVESHYGLALWEAVFAAGGDLGITPYGTETMHVLRAEKGFVIVGQDTDGTVTPLDLGMDWIVSRRKDFVGKRSLSLPALARPDRKHLVGLLPLDGRIRLPEGAQLVAAGASPSPPVRMLGHVTSSYRSAVLGRCFALALVESGRDRIGQVLHAPVDGERIAVEVTKPVFHEGEASR